MDDQITAVCAQMDAREDKRFSWFVPTTSGKRKDRPLLVIYDIVKDRNWILRFVGDDNRPKWRADVIDFDGRFALHGDEFVEKFVESMIQFPNKA